MKRSRATRKAVSEQRAICAICPICGDSAPFEKCAGKTGENGGCSLLLELLCEWRETYGGSTMPSGKPVDNELDERTDALLRSTDRTATRKKQG